MQPVLKILPGQQAEYSDWKPSAGNDPAAAEDFKDAYGFPKGKGAIHLLMQQYHIGRGDEVYIHTTSQSNYVSSCVTCTIFNYGKPSRVLTADTKMIYVIHEFGYPDPELASLLQQAKERQIPLVEDVAHSVNSFYQGRRLGTMGDYGIYSIPKFFDLSRGGLLLDNKGVLQKKNFRGQEEIVAEFRDRIESIPSITERKREIEDLFSAELKGLNFTYPLNKTGAPFVISLDLPDHQQAERIAGHFHDEFPMIELFPTHVPGRVAIPVNPYGSIPVYELIIKHIKELAL